MNIHKLKKIIEDYTIELDRDEPGIFSLNDLIDVLFEGYDPSGKRISKFNEITFEYINLLNSSIAIIHIKGDGKYKVEFWYDDHLDNEVANVEHIESLTMNNYQEISKKLNDMKKNMDHFLENMYDEKFERQIEIINFFAVKK